MQSSAFYKSIDSKGAQLVILFNYILHKLKTARTGSGDTMDNSEIVVREWGAERCARYRSTLFPPSFSPPEFGISLKPFQRLHGDAKSQFQFKIYPQIFEVPVSTLQQSRDCKEVLNFGIMREACQVRVSSDPSTLGVKLGCNEWFFFKWPPKPIWPAMYFQNKILIGLHWFFHPSACIYTCRRME